MEYFLLEIYISEKNEELSFVEELTLTINRIIEQSEKDLKKYLVIMDVFYHGINENFSKMDKVYMDYIKYMIKKIILL